MRCKARESGLFLVLNLCKVPRYVRFSSFMYKYTIRRGVMARTYGDFTPLHVQYIATLHNFTGKQAKLTQSNYTLQQSVLNYTQFSGI